MYFFFIYAPLTSRSIVNLNLRLRPHRFAYACALRHMHCTCMWPWAIYIIYVHVPICDSYSYLYVIQAHIHMHAHVLFANIIELAGHHYHRTVYTSSHAHMRIHIILRHCDAPRAIHTDCTRYRRHRSLAAAFKASLCSGAAMPMRAFARSRSDLPNKYAMPCSVTTK